MITLEQYALTTQDDIAKGLIDEFRKSSFIMDNITFMDTVAPGGGSTLTFGYDRLKTQATASAREINTEYTPQEAEIERVTGDLKVFGGAYQIDRVLAVSGSIVDMVQIQHTQKVKAVTALFNDMCINGDSAVDARCFDGLEKALTGSSTEFIPSSPVDLSESAMIDVNYKAFLDMLDEFLLGLDGVPTALFGNSRLIARLHAVARRAGMYQTTTDTWGRNIETYGTIPLVDLGAKAGSNEPVVGDDGGLTSLYAVRFGADAFHAYSQAGRPLINYHLPNFNESGSVKTGDVEMVAAVALKATKSAGVMRNIKVS